MPDITPLMNPADTTGAACPVDHSRYSRQKTARETEPTNRPVERDAAGTWHIRGFEEARAILRSATTTRQAGFNAEMIQRLPGKTSPILYQEGKEHQFQRKQTARFFTPKAVTSNYRTLMEAEVGQLIGALRAKKRADLSAMSMDLAVRVAGQVVGLTNSLVPGMNRRLDAFFSADMTPPRLHLAKLARGAQSQLRVLLFYWLDVRPAIRARKRTPQDDVISYLVAQDYSDLAILTECVTYAAAGMVTTREFICAAAWHFLEQPALRQRYLIAGEEERQVMLQEILRLEPVVGHLLRRATEDVTFESGGATTTIPAGDLIDLHIYATNADEQVVGVDALQICPARELRGERMTPAVMSFGDGHHRCPGSYIAIQETDMFLQQLLALDGVRIERAPALNWNDLVTGYELRNFRVAVN